MKGLIYTLILVLSISFLIGCKSHPSYVPIENYEKEKEYVDRWRKDSIYITKYVRVYQRGDTVFRDSIIYEYKDRLIKDSIFIKDSIRVEIPYPVVETKEVNRLKNWQILLMGFGCIVIGYLGFRVIRFFK